MAFNYNICSNCMSYMISHLDAINYLKCPTCGFSKKERKAMIMMYELLKDNNLEDQSQEIHDNLQELLKKMNEVRVKYNTPMIVTSGLRTLSEHLAIYKAKGITDPSKIPMKSKHLVGQAVDIQDSDGKLRDWVKDNMNLMEDIGFWFEDFDHTPGWVHFQIVPYGSWVIGKSRTFIP